MAIAITDVSTFPNGTVVEMRPANALRGDGGVAGAPLESQTMTAGSATFATAIDGTPYVFSGGGRTMRKRASVQDRGEATGTATTANGSTALSSVAAAAGAFRVGQRVAAPGVPVGARVADTGAIWGSAIWGLSYFNDGTSVVLSEPAKASAPGVAVQAFEGLTWRARLAQRRYDLGIT